MRVYEVTFEQRLGSPLEEVFPFFSDALNLGEVSPPWLRFRVITPPPIVMRPGARIDYLLRVHGFPIRWQSEITVWEPPYRFVDEQRRGPYRLWVHEHRFERLSGGTAIVDRVRYAVPFGWITGPLFVHRDVRRIFAHRHLWLEKKFGRIG